MFLIKFLFWLITLPIRIVLWVIGLALWVLTLPIRILFTILGLIGFGRLLQLGIVGGIGYFFYRLVTEPPPASNADLPQPPSEATLQSMPST